MQDMTRRQENDNLMRHTNIWWKKYGHSRLATINWKGSIINKQSKIWISTSQMEKYSYKCWKGWVEIEIGKTLNNWKKCTHQLLQKYMQPVIYMETMTGWNLTGIHTKFYRCNRKSMGVDLPNITNPVIIFLFIKNLCNKDIRQWVLGTKTINTLADSFKLAHHILLKLKKYKVLVYNEEHELAEINKIIDASNIGRSNNSKKPDKIVLKKTQKLYMLGNLLELWWIWQSSPRM